MRHTIGDVKSIIKKDGESMISYAPLWETMKRVGATTYTLREKGSISSSTVRRLQKGESVSTNTLDALCKLLDCRIADIAVFAPDKEPGACQIQ
jgi:DNA-binding Xre family transcriptional regulator